MEKEIWKDVPDYSGYYQCSNFGRLKSISRKKESYCKYNYSNIGKKEMFIGSLNKTTGYIQCSLSKNGSHKTYYVHEVIAITFLNYIKIGRSVCINHIDGNRSNNNVSNLEVVTMSYNVLDGFKRGRVIHNKRKINCKNARYRPIHRYNLNGDYIDSFLSSTDAERKTGINAANIRQNAILKSKTCKGFIFRHELTNSI